MFSWRFFFGSAFGEPQEDGPSPRQREVDISSEANFLASFHQSAGVPHFVDEWLLKMLISSTIGNFFLRMWFKPTVCDIGAVAVTAACSTSKQAFKTVFDQAFHKKYQKFNQAPVFVFVFVFYIWLTLSGGSPCQPAGGPNGISHAHFWAVGQREVPTHSLAHFNYPPIIFDSLQYGIK